MGMTNRTIRTIPQATGCCERLVVPTTPLREQDHVWLLGAFKALGDATRFDVFRCIASQGNEICACDVVDQFDVSQPTIAHHLKVLRSAGLITATRRGIWAYYAPTERGRALFASSLDAIAPATAEADSA